MGEKNRSGVRTEVRDGRKILVVDFRYRDKDGRERRYRRDAAVQSRPAAVAEAQRLKRVAAERGTMEAEPEPLTFEQFVHGDFAKLVLPRFKPSTREGYKWLLDKPGSGLVALIGHKRLDTIGAGDVRIVEADALARKARPRYAIVCLHTVLRSAAELGALAHSTRLPKLAARSAKLPASPPQAVVERVLAESRGWLRVAIALAALGGRVAARCGRWRSGTSSSKLAACTCGERSPRRSWPTPRDVTSVWCRWHRSLPPSWSPPSQGDRPNSRSS